MAAGQGLIKARRRLDDLFKMGVEIRFGGRYGEGELPPQGKDGFYDEDGKPVPLDESCEVAMWIQPPNPMQRDMALRNANAARSRAALAGRKEDSTEYLAALEFIDSMTEATLYDYVLIGEVDKRQQDAVREVLAEEEWSDITELQESLRIFEEEGRPEDDPEVVLVRERENELQAQVQKREHELWEAAHDVLQMKGPEAARKQAIEHHVDLQTSRAFMVEYERQMTWFSVRDPENHGVQFFESPMELASQPDPILALIRTAIDTRFIKDGSEAKNSQRAESGSALSAPPSKPETSESSTPEESTE